MVGTVALVHGKVEHHDAVAPMHIGIIGRGTLDAAIVDDLVPLQAVARHQGVAIHPSVVDGQVERDHAVASCRVGRHVRGMILLAVHYLPVPDGRVAHLLHVDS